MKKYKFDPPLYLKGNDDFAPATNPILQCPEHIVCSGSVWFCTECGSVDFTNYEHDVKGMVEFIANHRPCHKDLPKICCILV